MSPENNTRSTLGPLPRRSGWLAGGTLASLALVMTGISGPAFASPQGAQAAQTVTTVSTVNGGKCSDERDDYDPRKADQAGPRGGGGDEGCQGPTGPTGPRGPKGDPGPCSDVDAYRPNAATDLKAVLSNGVAYAGIRDLTGANAPTPFLWYDLTDTETDFPRDACAISIAAQTNAAGGVSIQTLTRRGEVWELTCDVEQDPSPTVGFVLDCATEWNELTTPVRGADGPPPVRNRK
ncbi:hypothetical protein ACF059_20875 [Streptomyces sp. NPDC016562]|uniref:hypothetical protein n=1 Tax=Streptomyces sp. NPDC016562 TaxID=3364966 RepID=UPI0036F4CDEF